MGTVDVFFDQSGMLMEDRGMSEWWVRDGEEIIFGYLRLVSLIHSVYRKYL